jgi:hypothetical protein
LTTDTQVRRSFLNWGVFLVSLGAVPLLVQLAIAPPSITGEVVRLWPVVLIGIGLGVMLRLTAFHLVGGVVVAATAGLVLGSLASGGIFGVAAACVPDGATAPMATRTGELTNPATVSLELSCVDLTLTNAAGSEWRLDAEQTGRAPIVGEQPGRLSIRSDDAGILGGQGQRWALALPDAAPLTLDMTLNAARARVAAASIARLSSTFNGADARVDLSASTSATVAFDGTLNGSSVTIVLPSTQLNGSLTLNASSLRVCAPPGVGLWIHYSSTLGTANFAEAGLTGAGSSWQTAGYAAAPAKASLNVTSNVSTINLDRSGGCQ